MVKSVLNTAYDFGQPLANIIAVASRGLDRSYLKAASVSQVFQDIEIVPDDKKAVIHLIAMGAAPYFPCNKNGDLFYDHNRSVDLKVGGNYEVEKGLEETHDTFVSHAKVYKEHFNTKDDKVYGDVLGSHYNKSQNRVELLISIPVDEWADELKNLERGNDVGFSMSTRVPYDVCSICGNKATKRKEYCDHLRYQLGQVDSDGFLVGAINDHTDFFDISGVRNPADRIAFGLLKVANLADTSGRVIGGAELSELLGVQQTPQLYWKTSSVLRKLADIEKQIEATASADDPVNSAVVVGDLPDNCLKQIKASSASTPQILGALSSAKVVLSLKDFLKVLTGPHFNEVEHLVDGASDRLPGVFGRMCVRQVIPDDSISLEPSSMPMRLSPFLSDMIDSNSFDQGPVTKRVTIRVISGDQGGFQLKSAAVKHDDSATEVVAQLYGQYKLAFCQKHLCDNSLTFYSVLSHYIQ